MLPIPTVTDYVEAVGMAELMKSSRRGSIITEVTEEVITDIMMYNLSGSTLSLVQYLNQPITHSLLLERDKFVLSIQPTQVRMEGSGPWKIYKCNCCPVCYICQCPKQKDCECKPFCNIKLLRLRDLHILSTDYYDEIAKVTYATSEYLGEWLYSDMRGVALAISRSLDNPLVAETEEQAEGSSTVTQPDSTLRSDLTDTPLPQSPKS